MSGRVVIAGGGTGGHIFPGLAVARELRAREIDVHWLGGRRGLEAELVPERGLPITLVDIEGIHARGPAAAARALALLPRAVATAVRTLLRVRPLAVVGVGGYASTAGLAASGLLGIPVVLQEQNSIPGWTNRSAVDSKMRLVPFPRCRRSGPAIRCAGIFLMFQMSCPTNCRDC